MMERYTPKVVCFSCNFGCGYLSDRQDLASQIPNWIPVVCTGKIETTHVFQALKSGAEGVLILGCLEGRCHFQDGNYRTAKKVHLLHKVIKACGIEPERVNMVMLTDAEGKRIPQLVHEMEENLKKLGPMKRE